MTFSLSVAVLENLNDSCQSPSEAKLDKLLLESIEKNIDLLFMNYDEIVRDDSPYAKIIKQLTPESIYANRRTQNCTHAIISNFKTDKPSLCTHAFEQVKRDDRYPYQIQYAVCCNRKCVDNNLRDPLTKEMEYRCEPVFDLRPILVRGFCSDSDNNGNGTKKYPWTFALEAVPIKCRCSVCNRNS